MDVTLFQNHTHFQNKTIQNGGILFLGLNLLLAGLLQTPNSFVTKVFFKFEQLVHSESVLKTYYLKTTLYWFYEQSNQEDWTFQNVGKNVLHLLDKLIKFLENRYLPNYFIPSNNLIEHIDFDSVAYHRTMEILTKIRKFSIGAMISCRQYSCYSEIVYGELFQPILDALYCPTTDYNRIILTLMKISKRHHGNAEYGLAKVPFEDLCGYLKLYEDELTFPVTGWLNDLAYCYNRTGDLERCLTTSEEVFQRLSIDDNTECSLLGGVLMNIAYLHFAKALRSNVSEDERNTLLADVKDKILLAQSFYDESDETKLDQYAIWLAQFANFCLRTGDDGGADWALTKALSISHTTKDDIMITPCEIITTDQMFQNFFSAKQKAARILRFDYDRYIDCIFMPTLVWAYYLCIELATNKGDMDKTRSYLDLFENFIETHMPKDESRGMLPLHWCSLLGHCYLKISDLEKAEFYFAKRYSGPYIDVEENKYHEETLEIHKLYNMFECFL